MSGPRAHEARSDPPQVARVADEVTGLAHRLNPLTERFEPSAVMSDLRLPPELLTVIANVLRPFGFRVGDAEMDSFGIGDAVKVTRAVRGDEHVHFLHVDRRIIRPQRDDSKRCLTAMKALLFQLPVGEPIRLFSVPLAEPDVSFLGLQRAATSKGVDLQFVSYGMLTGAVATDLDGGLLVDEVLKLTLGEPGPEPAPAPEPEPVAHDGPPPHAGAGSLFVSYSSRDRDELEHVLRHLGSAKRLYGLDVEIWSDQEIQAGDDWAAVIDEQLERADAALLLLSTSFFESDFIAQHELPRIVDKADEDELALFWVQVRACLPQDLSDPPEDGWLGRIARREAGLDDPHTVLLELDDAQRDRALTELTSRMARRLRESGSD